MISFIVSTALSLAGLAIKLIGLVRKTPAQKVEKADDAMLRAAVDRPDDSAVDQRLRGGKF